MRKILRRLGFVICSVLMLSCAIVAAPAEDSAKIPRKAAVDYYRMQDASIFASYAWVPKNLADMESESDIIILATVEEILGPRIKRNESDGQILYGSTHSRVKIDHVWKGDVSAGDSIIIDEPYLLLSKAENDGVEAIMHFEGYYPSTVGKQYLWMLMYQPNFLKQESVEYDISNCYSLTWMERGRYPLIDPQKRAASDLSTLTYEDLNLSPSANIKTYQEFLTEAVTKYMTAETPEQ